MSGDHRKIAARDNTYRCDQLSVAQNFRECVSFALFGGDVRVLAAARVFDHLRDIRQALPALGPRAAAAEDLADGLGVLGIRLDLAVVQRIANADVHGTRNI
ncbi:MAG: hypothetical protein U5J99_00770 [Parvularculaceae bacterium]|nr:hypothetical protein [Parvularculaceae bacterium]